MRALVLFLVVSWLATANVAVPDEPKKPAVEFQRDVLPIFEAKCNRCHGVKQKGGGLDTRTVAALLKGGVSGPAFTPGMADKSLMVDMMHYNEMPPKKEKMRVSKEELDRIKAWVDATDGKK